MLDGKALLITGGSGSLGNAVVEKIHSLFQPKKVIVYSRSEYNQYLMREKCKGIDWLRFQIGDVRDVERLKTSLRNVDYVIHAAALKHIDVCEYSPLEAIKTNIDGSANVINACMETGVKRCVLVSTDKAHQPQNLYGATKMAAERLFIAANNYQKTEFRVVRYGNVLASHGSVVELFLKLKAQGIHEFPITDPEMTRFFFELPRAAEAVLTTLLMDNAPPIFIPKLPSMRITDLAKAIDPDCTFRVVGRQPGEKLHEALIEGYTSDKNSWWLSQEEIQKIFKKELDAIPSTC